jgi:SAM-dependent methyltransferase
MDLSAAVLRAPTMPRYLNGRYERLPRSGRAGRCPPTARQRRAPAPAPPRHEEPVLRYRERHQPETVVDSVRSHYQSLLAPVYAWLMGGAQAAFARGEMELESLRLTATRRAALALDLGAGFGMHSIPLARRGFSVVAVDSSAALLAELRGHADTLPIRTVEADLLDFPRHIAGSVDVILCMGDTLTHLESRRAIESLFAEVAAALLPGGMFVLTFRDYAKPLIRESRFVPVKSDGDRLFTCFLEYGNEHVDVYDLLHERQGSQWTQRVSSYRKLRLPPDWVSATLRSAGFHVMEEVGLSGMIRLVARATALSS